jgi:hypothetical protein
MMTEEVNMEGVIKAWLNASQPDRVHYAVTADGMTRHLWVGRTTELGKFLLAHGAR